MIEVTITVENNCFNTSGLSLLCYEFANLLSLLYLRKLLQAQR